MSAKIFLSTVSDEFCAYRDQLRSDLTRHNVEVKVQEDFNWKLKPMLPTMSSWTTIVTEAFVSAAPPA